MRIIKTGMLCILDENWLYSYLPEHTNTQISMGKLPNDLFVKTIQNGYLYYLGTIFFDHLFNIIDDVLFYDVKEAYTESYMIFLLLSLSGLEESKALFNLLMALDEVDTILCEAHEKHQNGVFHKQGIDMLLRDALVKAREFYESDIKNIRDIYAKNYAERTLHDRQICEYIAYSLHSSYEEGYPVLDKNYQISFAHIERSRWPTWVKSTLRTRDRDHCANCGLSFGEFHGKPHIDHIVPLNKGGCNDLVNLQLLCSRCNRNKHDNFQLVNSSIPEYFERFRKPHSN